MKILLILALFSIANGNLFTFLDKAIDSPIDAIDDLLTMTLDSPIDGIDDLLTMTLDSSWTAFKDMFGKSYDDDEEDSTRKDNFKNNLKKAAIHNANPSNYTLGVNKYSDLSPEEVRNHRMGFRGPNNYTSTSSTYPNSPQGSLPAATVDWRTKGYVTPVKDQGSCGSCYSFSATGALEGQLRRKTGKLVSLSEQNIIDCTMSEGNGGCDGGWMNQAFKWIQKNKGISTEAGYPYIEDVSPICAYNKATKGATVTGYVNIPVGDEQALRKTVASVGPLSVAVNANGDFPSYQSGIYNPVSCPNTIDDLTHAVLIVGYGTENGEDYWLVKNSWGTTWGLKGYIKMARNKNNLCGIATKASYPLV